MANHVSRLNLEVFVNRLRLAFPNVLDLFKKYPPSSDEPDEWGDATMLCLRLLPDHALRDLHADLLDLMTLGWNEEELYEILRTGFGVDAIYPVHFRLGYYGPMGWLVFVLKRVVDVKRERRSEPDSAQRAA